MNTNIINSFLISADEIEHVQILKKGRNFIINGMSSYNCNINERESLNNVFAEISNYVNKNKLTHINIIKSDKILKHIITFENVSPSNIRTDVLNDFKSTFDIKLSDYYIDYEIYNFKNYTIVFVAGILREFLENIINSFKKFDFHLLSIEVDINSLKRLIQRFYPDNIIMNLHMRKEDTLFIVMEKSRLFSFREINFGYNSIKSLNEDDNIYLKEDFSKLTIELQRTIDFYNNQFKYKPINKFVLTGELLNIPEVDKYLSSVFLVESEKFFPLKQFYVNIDLPNFNKLNYLTELLGTALREI